MAGSRRAIAHDPMGVLPSRHSNDFTFSPSPSTVAGSQMTAFMGFCAAEVGRRFSGAADFYEFSVADLERFWLLFLRWSDLRCAGSPHPVCTDPGSCERALFFPNHRVSYVDNVLRIDQPGDAERLALVAHHASRPPDRLARGELRGRVAAAARGLRRLGVRPGDRVVAIARNNAELVIGGLAAAAVGAAFSSTALDMGAVTVLGRFEQLKPTLLMANLAPEQGVEPGAPADRVAEIVRGLPTLRAVVALDDGPVPAGMEVPVERLARFTDGPLPAPTADDFPLFPFNHPLFVLFSSGTTGRPKCIVHGAGGTLLEHLKEHRLHVDLGREDRLFFHTSAAWMMWNWQLSALATGAAIVVYDGPVAGADTLWRMVEAERVTVFGTSPPYLRLCAESGYTPREELSLHRLRALLSTGSILQDWQYDWVWDRVGSIPVQSISGGTDIIGCFVLGNPNLPIRRGEIQCRSLGLDVRAISTASSPSGADVGELVCRNPFPSRPLGFVDDEDGDRFHEAYFSQNDGLWTHGDLVEIGPDGTVRMHGRSDGIINVGAVRIGPAEIVRALEGIPEIREAMAVEQQTPDRRHPSRVVLFVVLREPGTLDVELVGRIRREIARVSSPLHVPRLVVDIDQLPTTHSGKRSERAVRDVLNGGAVGNADALANPASLETIARRVAEADRSMRRRTDAREESTTGRLLGLWEEVLGLAPLRPDDSFFDLGGTSLDAIELFDAIHEAFGVDLPLSTLLEAGTVEAVADIIDTHADRELPLVVPLKPGTSDRVVFLVHGGGGDLFALRLLVSRLSTDRAVFGIRARGLDPRAMPHTSDEDMAVEYLRHVRAVQPAGPYALGGYSLGGLVAFEMAQLLTDAGEVVDPLLLLDTYVHHRCLPGPSRWWFRLVHRQIQVLGAGIRNPGKLRSYVAWRTGGVAGPAASPPVLMRRLHMINTKAHDAFRAAPYPGQAVLFRAQERVARLCDPVPVWARLVEQGLTVEPVPGGHEDMLSEACVDALADRVSAHLS
jgi:acetoacetyl-CoA synthetase